jgi:phage shock protein C
MYCTCCGVQLHDTAKFCSDCGQSTTRPVSYASAQHPRLSRPRDDRKIAGVCAGFARYMGVDVTLVRVIALVLLLVPPSIGLIAYIVAWIVMPNDPWVAPAPYAAPANGHA